MPNQTQTVTRVRARKSPADLSPKTEKEILDSFLADNPDLEELSARLAQFNIFHVLDIEHAEIRHSNTLAWLLDPAKSHGLGDHFLRRFLSNLLLNTAKESALSSASVELMDFPDVEVRREWENIDLTVVDRKNRFVLLIENKVYAREHSGQLARYRRTMEKEFPGHIILPKFLTLDGTEASDDEGSAYHSFSHAQLHQILEKIFNQRQSQLSPPVATFIGHYLDVLRKITMKDTEVTELCKRIYRKHREAIDLIVERGQSSPFQEVTESRISAKKTFLILDSGPSWVWLIPHAWMDFLPNNGTSWSFSNTPKKYGIICWIHLKDNSIRLAFEIGGMTDPKTRLGCVKTLADSGFTLQKAAFKDGAVYSRFVSLTRKLDDITDREKLSEAVDQLLEESAPDLAKATKVLASYFLKS